MLPILVPLFLISYGLMSMLVIEQNSTITSQRYLIQEMLKDSTQLSALKIKIAQDQHAATHPGSQAASPKTQDQAPEADHKNNGGAGKVRKHAPQRPPKATSDTPDERRALVTI
jgi:hypothetical protein